MVDEGETARTIQQSRWATDPLTHPRTSVELLDRSSVRDSMCRFESRPFDRSSRRCASAGIIDRTGYQVTGASSSSSPLPVRSECCLCRTTRSNGMHTSLEARSAGSANKWMVIGSVAVAI